MTTSSYSTTQLHWVDRLAERLVVPSFSRVGPWLRQRLYGWPPLSDWSLTGKTVVLTGGTSGIGALAAEQIATMGARLVVVARDAERANTMLAEIRKSTGNDDLHVVIADLGVLADVRQAAAVLAKNHPVIDVLMHNAGALFNERRLTADGLDLTVELMVSTPFLLTGLLLDQLTAAPNARVLTMSSGGMYTAQLHVDQLHMPDDHYQGAKQYARAKRAQVVLNELWAQHANRGNIRFHALHPGWVATPGIEEALPGFSRWLARAGLLREPAAGADTMIWLAVADAALECNGRFWHDRAVRTTHMSKRTRQSDTAEQRAALWSWCESRTGGSA